MDNRMLERIIIIILALLDLFLLGVVVTDHAETRRNETDTERYVTEVLRSNGISVEKGVALLQDAPAGCTLARSSLQEQKIVQGLLGRKFVTDDLGGNITYYRSEDGQAVFRGSGGVEALLNSGTVSTRSGSEKTAARLLRRMGISAEKRDAGVNESDGEAFTEFYCCCNGCLVYNAILRIDFSGDSPYLLTGSRVFDTVTVEESSGLMNSVSALLRFVEVQQSGEFSFTVIKDFQAGYLMSVLVSGESTMTPVWRLETDTGALIINAENGRVENGYA